jgi:hypothetical protein
MISEGRRLWGVACAVGILWLIIAVLASSTFLILGAIIYGLMLVAFLVAEIRPAQEDIDLPQDLADEIEEGPYSPA